MAFWTRKRRWLAGVLILSGAVLAVVARPAIHLIRTALSDRDEIRPLPAGTVRDVRQDHDSLLRYADRDMVSHVMLFNQPRTAEAETRAPARVP